MISILTPSRHRQDRLREMMTSAMDTAGAPIEFVIYVDDDLMTESYLNSEAAGIKAKGHKLRVLRGERGLLARYWNDCAREASGNIFQLANDDIVFRTPGWAVKVEEAFKCFHDKIGVVHTNNGQSNAADFCTHPFVTRKWVDIVGYFVPPCFAGDFTDTWIWALSEAIGRRHYIPEVMVEHMHWIHGKSTTDKTYQERTASEGGMKQLYDELLPLRELAVFKLRTVINS